MIDAVRNLWSLAGPERPALVRGFVFTALASLLQAVPAVMAVVVVLGLRDGDITSDDVGWVTAVCLGSVVARFALARAANGSIWVVAYELTGRLRHELLDRIRAAPPAAVARRGTGEALTVLTFDAGKIAGFVSWELPVLVGGVVLPLTVLIAMAVVAPPLAVVAAAVTLTAIPVLRYGLGRVVQVYADRRALQSEATEHMLEYVRGIEVIRSHGLADDRRTRFAEALEEIRDADVASVERLTPAYSAFQTLVDAGFALLLASAAVLVALDTTSPDALVASLVLSTVLFRPQLDLGARALHLPELAACTAKVADWMALEPAPDRPEVDLDLASEGGAAIEIRGVRAGYGDGPDVLCGVDLRVDAGAVVAVVGASGAGKSTLTRVVGGLLDIRSGSVSVGGADLTSMPPGQAASLFSAVFQDLGLLRGTVHDVVAAGRPTASRAEVVAAAQAARIHDRIETLPHGYDTELGEEGRGLSGGERQRLAIARALCKAAPVVLLDEATSALDSTNELLLREAVADLTRGRTVLIVAHRLETIRTADRIVVLDAGRIVEQGTHDELLELGGHYAGFWATRHRAAGWRLSGGARAATP